MATTRINNLRPTAYLAPQSWYEGLDDTPCIELYESFPKQTFRNRCTLLMPNGQPITLSVPVKKVEHKQLTRDIQISYQTHWQHQHWIALLSAYKHTPYFDYYAEFFLPFYTRETRFLVDLNAGLDEVIRALMQNRRPAPCNMQLLSTLCEVPIQAKGNSNRTFPHTHDWQQQDLEPLWGNSISIVDCLFKKGPYWYERD